MGKNPTNKGKITRRLAQMWSAQEDETAVAQWERPPDEECSEEHFIGPAPGCTDVNEYRAIFRMSRQELTSKLVEFAIILQVQDQGEWVTFAEVDSCHDTDAHLHIHSRAAGQRTGQPERLVSINSLDDVQTGYEDVLGHLATGVAALHRRWHHG